MSPPLLHPLLVSPMMVSRGMTADLRCNFVSKTRISPMLLDSTTNPLLAQRPWSGGSMSPTDTLVGCVALSTAFKPFTPVAPPENELIMSQPGPNGWQLTLGGVIVILGPKPCGGRGRLCDGITLGLGDGIEDSVGGLAPVEFFEKRGAVDGVKKGPVSKEQP